MADRFIGLRELANNTLVQTGPNVPGSASWFRARATELALALIVVLDRVDELTGALQDALALTHVPDHSQDDTWYAERERLQKVADNG